MPPSLLPPPPNHHHTRAHAGVLLLVILGYGLWRWRVVHKERHMVRKAKLSQGQELHQASMY